MTAARGGKPPLFAMYGGYDMGEQYKQLQFRDRLKIEARLNIGYKPKHDLSGSEARDVHAHEFRPDNGYSVQP